MFFDTDARYTRDLETWVDAARDAKPARDRTLATVMSVLAAAAVVGTILGGGAA